MTTLWVVLAILAVGAVAAFGYVAWRDRRRTDSTEDATAGRDARSRQQRYEADRHGSQGDTWHRGDRNPNG